MADLEFSEQILRDIIRSELAAQPKACRLPITDDQCVQIGIVVDELTNSGKVNLGEVVRDTQSNHIWLKKQRERGEKFSTVVAYTVVVGVVSGLCAAVWKGLTIIIKEG